MRLPAAVEGQHAIARRWAGVLLLLAAATLAAAGLDREVSLTSQAMLYLLAVVVASYVFGWLESVACAIGAVAAFNFFFVPPRWTLAVEHREHFIALIAMLTVALLISHLTAGVRRQAALAELNETRARQLQALAGHLTDAATDDEVLAHGQAALRTAFSGPCVLAICDEHGNLRNGLLLPEQTRDGLRCCMSELAVIGPGTGRWPGLPAWYMPLGDNGRVVGAACIEPAIAEDVEARKHAQALCTLLSQAVWRLRLSAVAMPRPKRSCSASTCRARSSPPFRTTCARRWSTIVGAASSLRSQRERLAKPRRTALLGSIAQEATYLSTLTENTLQLVRLSGDALELRRDWESIEEIVGRVLARVRQRDPRRRIGSRVPPGLPLVRADAVLLAQLLRTCSTTR